MKNPVLIKTFNADGAITARRIVKPGSSDFQVAQAAAATDAVFGVSEVIDADDGDRVDVVTVGIAEVEYGGNISAGNLVTADANGKAVQAAPAAGANNRIAGTALIGGVDGDYGYILIGPGQIQGA